MKELRKPILEKNMQKKYILFKNIVNVYKIWKK